ncbi:DUF2125 domain-containing protein [Roseivivax isoporae]|uniref:DUF2125 domain-containing protein n=1 Tax=Roseivivax isoporae LMG 25204 TaxID=1449351 RepID=X7F4D9_9RHOB|nr:DUF2125 domain-containing protein [Roseivivax isoporae]ETX27578.1 hypothetical protein RISW2_13135 [Roseivivax isoporae LMG 25204]
MRPMKWLAFAVVVLALGWSAFWFLQVRWQRAAIEAWFDARRAEGWQASYEALEMRGFPNRIDATFTGLVLGDPEGRVTWEAPFAQVFRLAYRPGHVIVAWPETQSVETQAGRVAIESAGLRGSLELSGLTFDRVARLVLEAESLTLVPDFADRLALAEVHAALAATTDDPVRYRTALSGVAAGDAEGDPERASLDAVVTLTAPITTDGARTDITAVDLNLAEYVPGPARLRLSGDFDVDGEGRLSGDLDLQAEEWRDLVADAADRGRIDPGIAEGIEDAIGFVATLRGNPDTLDLGIRIDEGSMFLGPVPLGPAPRLRLP